MDTNSALVRIEKICKTVFNDDSLSITTNTSAKDVEKWDSLTNLFLIDAVEKEFGIKFSLDEILIANNIGDLISCIQKK